jgi:choline dehydrogenase-like flavoprotein
VLLLEAGRASHPWSAIPVGMARLITNPAANWLYSSEPEPSANGRRLPVPRGKLLGGSSSINGMVFVRGQAQDFDTWAQMGNQGWSYADVLPFFKRMESYAGEGDDGRWCTCRTEPAMTPTPIRYAMTRVRRTESGRPAASIWFSTATPMAASVRCAAKPRARNRGPISAL